MTAIAGSRAQVVLALAYSAGAAALAVVGGVVLSVLTLAGLVVSYGPGLFGWREAGFRTSIAVDVVATVVAAIVLTLALLIAAAPAAVAPGRARRYLDRPMRRRLSTITAATPSPSRRPS
jgi:hypothetical protein